MNDLLALARTAARTAGEGIRAHYGNTAYELKDDNSPITIADREAHECIVTILSASGIPILSEEDVGIPLPYPERLWIIDPLDGTKGFLKKTDDFSVLIALLENGKPVLAVVDAPVLNKHYFALRGNGAYVLDTEGERRLSVSTRVVPNLRGVVSVNHAAPYMFEVCKALQVKEEVAVGSIGIKAGYVAENKADFYLTRGALGEWDVCASELILTEAGGTVTDEHGDPLCYGNEDHRIKHGVVFSNGVCHEAALEALRKTETPLA